MIIVDDKLSLDALAGTLDWTEAVATTWGFHYRLVRALRDEERRGARRRSATDLARTLAADPPPSLLQVLDPRDVTILATEMAAHHGLNVLASELVAAAVHHRAAVQLSAPNVGRRWPEVLAAEGISLRIV